jgi:hypothetical protein
MSKTTRVVLVCDLHGDGTEAVTTIRMDNGTARYELDLCQSHFDELTGAGRRLRPRRRTGAARSATKPASKAAAKTRRRGGSPLDTAAVRANGPAPMAIRSAIAVESPVTSWKPSPPPNRRLHTQNRQDPGGSRLELLDLGVTVEARCPGARRGGRSSRPRRPLHGRRQRDVRPYVV